MNKKITTLAAAILAASSADASWNFAFVAVDDNGDTYVQNIRAGEQTVDVSAVNSAIDTYSWTVVGTSETNNVIAAPPANAIAGPPGAGNGFHAYDDTGIITTSSGAPSSINVSHNMQLDNEKAALDGWFSTVSTLASGAGFVVISGSSSDKYTVGQQVALHAGRMQTDTGINGAFQLNEIFHSDDNNFSPGFSTPAINSYAYNLDFDGSTLYHDSPYGSPVPVPAAAWLFGSALAGLGVVRRKK